MNATTQRRRPRTTRGKPLVNDDQLLEAAGMIQTMLKRGWTQEALAKALGYANKESIRLITKLANYPTFERYTELKRLHAQTEVPAVATPQTPPAPARSVAPRNGALTAITEADSQLKAAADALRAASTHAIPLLRPGLLQVSERIDQVRKELII